MRQPPPSSFLCGLAWAIVGIGIGEAFNYTGGTPTLRPETGGPRDPFRGVTNGWSTSTGLYMTAIWCGQMDVDTDIDCLGVGGSGIASTFLNTGSTSQVAFTSPKLNGVLLPFDHIINGAGENPFCLDMDGDGGAAHPPILWRFLIQFAYA